MSDGGIVRRFAVPPQKIACGFYHSVAVSNLMWAEDKAQHNKSAASEDKELSPDELPLTIHSWGSNEHHQLGHPSQRSRSTKGARDPDELVPKRIESGNFSASYGELYQVSCGASHTMFLLKRRDAIGGQLFCAGHGLRGRLGMRNPAQEEDEEIEDSWTTESGPIGPIPVINPKNSLQMQVLRVDCGADHTVCFCMDGRLYAWGANKNGQCGVGDMRDVKKPRQVITAWNTDSAVNHFATGAEHTMAAVGDGQLWVWGSGRNGRLGLGFDNNVSQPTLVEAIGETLCLYVAAGEAHSGMIDHRGKVWCWGAGSYGRLGTGEEDDVQVPRFIDAFEEMTDPPGQVKMVQLALGGFHTLFLEEPEAVAGRVFSAGCGWATGFAGEGENVIVKEPRHLADSNFGSKGSIKQIAAGTYHNFVLLENGDMVRWGSGANGRLGQFDRRVKNIASPEAMKQFNGYAMRPYLALQAKNVHVAEEKVANFTHPSERQPRQKKQIDDKKATQDNAAVDVQQVACGSTHTMALIAGGQLYLWGSNSSGQLGLGVGQHHVNIKVPRKLPVGNSRRIKEIAAGYEHCLAVTFNAELWSWGKGASGQLGTGRSRESVEPTLVTALQQVLTVGAGEEHSAAICMLSGGQGKQLYTFGSAENGMLGLGEDFMSGPQSTPMPVMFPIEDMIPAQTRAGGAKAKAKGKAKAKAAASNGVQQFWPQKVKCGLAHTAVIVGLDKPALGKDDPNKVFTFGAGWFGRLGLNVKTNVYSPKAVNFNDDVTTQVVECGGYHTASLSTHGDLYMWGRKEMVCDMNDDVLVPQKFLLVEGQPDFKAVSCGEMHTIVVTVRGDIFVWGHNKSGQLGLGHRVDMLTPDKIDEITTPCLFCSAGTVHSLALVQTGDIYAWGNQTCGRLGLSESQVDKFVATPFKVSAEWASIQAMTLAQNEKSEQARNLDDMFPDDAPRELEPEKSEELGKPARKQDEKASDKSSQSKSDDMLKTLSHQKVTSFGTMQMLIKQEKDGSRPAKLKIFEQELKKQFEKLLADIRRIPEEERKIKAIEGDVQQSLESNLRYFKTSHPEIGSGKINARFIDMLPTYQTLLWVLQLQVMYLVEMSVCVRTSEENRNVFYRILTSLFADAGPRTSGLFQMLLRLMISKEIEQAPKLVVDKVFDQEKSRAFNVFKMYCLSHRHWVDLIHKYMQAGTSSAGTETLFTKLKKSAEAGEYFTTSAKDYREVLAEVGEAAKGGEEYTFALSTFQEWMVNEFLTAIKAIDLPMDIRMIFNFCYSDVESRQPEKGEACEDVPDEQLNAYPLLFLFCHGILIPILTDPDKYVSKEVLLGRSHDAIDAYMRSNMKRTAMYLEKMIDDSWVEQERRLFSTNSSEVKVQLLKYLQRQADVLNDLEARTLVNTYRSHYDRSLQMVTMPVSDLMQLTIMLKRYDSHLRLNQNDEMAQLVRLLPKWTSEEIEHHQKNDRLYNFHMRSRFLFEESEEKVQICPRSQILMPARLCCTGGADGFFREHEASGSDDPRQALEILFGEIAPLKATTFAEMKEAFQEQRLSFKKSATPSYEIEQRLGDGLKVIEELENGQAYPEDVLSFMSASLIGRDKHYKYLKMIELGLQDLTEVTQKQYWHSTSVALGELDRALDKSRALEIPQKIKTAAGALGARSLKFVQVQDQLAKKAFAPDQAKDLKLELTPVRDYTFKKLVKMGVLDNVLFPPYDDDTMKQNMSVTLQSTSTGDVKLIVNIIKKKNVTNIKTMTIAESVLQDMKSIKEGVTTPLQNPGEKPFLICYPSEFVKTVQALGKETV